ncbi:MAG: hypothetical protein ACKO5K_13235 [Armatimonadota bacterium]
MSEPILDCFALFGAVPPRGAEPGTAALTAAHAKVGVSGALVLSTRGIYHSALAGNRETQALCAESGGKLLPTAVIDPRVADVAGMAKGARALALFPAHQGWPVRYAPLERCLKALAAAGNTAPLLVDVARPGDATALGEVLSSAGYSGNVVLLGVGGEHLAEAVAVAANHANISIGTDRLSGVGEIAMTVATLGAARVVFASGCVARGSLSAAVAAVRVAAVSNEDRTAIFSGTAKRLLAGGGAG